MHPPHVDSQDGPENDPYIVIRLPPLCDEAALQLSELIQELHMQVFDFYEEQIARANRKHALEERRCTWEREFLSAQMELPFDDKNMLPFNDSL
jgi:hypothetical protein